MTESRDPRENLGKVWTLSPEKFTQRFLFNVTGELR